MFFSNFPFTAFMINGNPGIIADFFRRVTASSQFAAYNSSLMPYLVLDGETPDLMSNRMYGTPDYHWVLLLINNVTNPFHDWPMPSKAIIPLLYSKYDFVVGTTGEFAVDDLVRSSDDGTFIVSAVGDSTVSLRSAFGKTVLAIDSILENVSTETENITITSVDDPEDTIHHYEDLDGNWVDFNPTLISQETNIAVSNLDYETNLNDAKRTKYVLDQDFLTSFVQAFNQAIAN